MHSNICTVILLLVSSYLQPGLSAGDLHYGLKQAEKVVKGICWLEYMKSPSSTVDIVQYRSCKNEIDQARRLKLNDGTQLTALNEDNNLSSNLQHFQYLCSKLKYETTGEYDTCLGYVNDANQPPVTDYGWMFLGEETEYPYRAVCHCLLEVAETRRGREGMNSLRAKWDKWDEGNPDIIYGLSMFQTVAYGICYFESKAYNVDSCYGAMNFNATFFTQYDLLPDKTPETMDTILPGELHDYVFNTIQNYLPNYSDCLWLLTFVDRDPMKDYSSVLNDEVGEYTYKGAAYCLVEQTELLYGKSAIEELKDYILKIYGSQQPTQIEQEEVPLEVEVEMTTEKVKQSKFSIEDVKYGLAQAQKVVKGVCWIEYLNKAYPENDGGGRFLDCKKSHDYIHFLQKCQGETTTANENENSYMECLQNEIQTSMKNSPPEYNSCLKYLENVNQKPEQDYGEFLEDSEQSEYPYKAYSHCLIQKMEIINEKQSLVDLKRKWKNPKTIIEALLERENEHRSRHSSGPLEINEELIQRAQKWADHLATEVCEPDHSPYSGNPDRKMNGTKCGENVSFHSDLTLSDDEMAVITAVTWYKENEFYPWPLFNGFMNVWAQNMVGHFTQSVWKDTKQVGYAISRGTESCNKIFVVARYWPVGNTFWKEGQEKRTKNAFEKNVLPLIK